MAFSSDVARAVRLDECARLARYVSPSVTARRPDPQCRIPSAAGRPARSRQPMTTDSRSRASGRCVRLPMLPVGGPQTAAGSAVVLQRPPPAAQRRCRRSASRMGTEIRQRSMITESWTSQQRTSPIALRFVVIYRRRHPVGQEGAEALSVAAMISAVSRTPRQPHRAAAWR